MAWASKSYTFSPSTVAKSSEVNQNFDDMVAGLNTAMPSGGIIMWSGSIASIPSGWLLCNGTSGTPDLRDRFVVGAGSTYAVGATGGAATHTLTTDEIPSHSHPTDADKWFGTRKSDSTSTPSDDITKAIGFADATVSAAGGGGAHNNLPPYYALAFIMKS